MSSPRRNKKNNYILFLKLFISILLILSLNRYVYCQAEGDFPIVSKWYWPIRNAKLLQNFGGYNSSYKSYHAGMDVSWKDAPKEQYLKGEHPNLSASQEIEVYSAADGKIADLYMASTTNKWPFWAGGVGAVYDNYHMQNVVILGHKIFDNKTNQLKIVYSLYAHLGKLNPNIKKGDDVKGGETPLGYIGIKAGFGKAENKQTYVLYHVHFEIKNAPILGNPEGKGFGYTPENPDKFGYLNPENFGLVSLGTQPPQPTQPPHPKSITLGPYPLGLKYYLRVFNVDDVSRVKINGREVLSVPYYKENELDITGYLREGQNSIELTLENTGSGWTYGYTLKQGGNFIWNETCGSVGREGCRNNDQTRGIVARHSINLSISAPTVTPPPKKAPTPSDIKFPNVTSFSASSSQINQGQSVTLSYGVSDDVGLSYVRLMRADDSAKIDFREIRKVSISGTQYSGTISDTPPSSGTYRYGLHVVDTSGKWNCERNSQTNFSPGQYGPKQVIVSSVQQTPVYNDLKEWLFKNQSVQITSNWNIIDCNYWSFLTDCRHTGIDFGAKEGTPVYSATDGVVINIALGSDCKEMKCLSTVAVWNESIGVTFLYLHMMDINVAPNSPIKAGDPIGKVSQRGPATGPHLHFEARPGRHSLASLDARQTIEPYEAARKARQIVSPIPSDIKPPNVTSFSASSSQITQGQSVTLSFSVSDDVGLSRVELWRADDSAGVGFREIKRVSISGTQYSGSISDTPPSSGTYRYGLHVVDGAGKWNCERNSQTNNSPGQYGPKQVVVGGSTPAPAPTPSDARPPNVTSFSASSSQITQGQSVTLSYSVTDDVGLKQVELWRADDTAGVGFREIKRVTVSGTSYSGTITDAPTAAGTYRYGIHVVDMANKWNCERNSQTNNSPGIYGPKQVVVGATVTPQLMANIVSYSPSSKIAVNRGSPFSVNVSFKNTGNTADYFWGGVTILNSSGQRVFDSFGQQTYLGPNQQGSNSWTVTLNASGEYWIQFGLWNAAKTQLLDKKPSPSQNFISIK